MAATAGAALAAVFSPGYAIPRGRCAPKNSVTAVFLFVAALRVRPAPGRTLPLPSRLRLARLRSTKGDLEPVSKIGSSKLQEAPAYEAAADFAKRLVNVGY